MFYESLSEKIRIHGYNNAIGVSMNHTWLGQRSDAELLGRSSDTLVDKMKATILQEDHRVEQP